MGAKKEFKKPEDKPNMDDLMLPSVGYQVTHFGENKRFTRQLNGFQTPGHAKDDRLRDKSRSCPGQQGRSVYFLVAQPGEQVPEGGKFLGKQGPKCFDGDIVGPDAGAARC
jgi:hypothetical protein